MTAEEATRLIAMLQAAYRTHLEPEELVVYAGAVAELPRPEVAEAAVGKLIREEPRFPPISLIREEYKREAAYHTRPELDEPPLTPEQIAFNVQAGKALQKRMEAAIVERSKRVGMHKTKKLSADPKASIWTDDPETWPEFVPQMVEPKEAG